MKYNIFRCRRVYYWNCISVNISILKVYIVVVFVVIFKIIRRNLKLRLSLFFVFNCFYNLIGYIYLGSFSYWRLNY